MLVREEKLEVGCNLKSFDNQSQVLSCCMATSLNFFLTLYYSIIMYNPIPNPVWTGLCQELESPKGDSLIYLLFWVLFFKRQSALIQIKELTCVLDVCLSSDFVGVNLSEFREHPLFEKNLSAQSSILRISITKIKND